ncbi:MAG: hypothetical protein RBS99_18790, partial [Rhodospirillales bacterium]|nr:hypothetical protein [Rhodospirillales bacterium]
DRFDLTVTDLGQLAMALVEAGTIVIATPTVLEGPHPLAASAAYTVNMLNPKARFLGAVGSFAWNSKAILKLKALLADMEAEWLPPVVGRGHPSAEAAQGLDGLADAIVERHRQSGFA